MTSKCIGLALSGGGYRALVFHLGVLARLASDNLLEEVSFISTVSGGSLATALIYASNDYRWPSSQVYLDQIVPEIRRFLPRHNLVREISSLLFRSPSTWLRRGGNKLAALLLSTWGIQASMQAIADYPRWVINATCYETAKNWRFMSRRMGDYKFGYVMNPEVPLAQAVAASAAHPLIGPVTIDTAQFQWEAYVTGSNTDTRSIRPKYKKVSLWDGAVYDNSGDEALIKSNSQLREGIDFLIVSDASAPIKEPKYWLGYPSARRMYDITANRAQSLQTRSTMGFLVNQPTKGRYFKLGNHADYILDRACKSSDIASLRPQTLPKDKIDEVRSFETEDTSMTIEKFDFIFRHGFEVADLTLYAHGSADDGYEFKRYASLYQQ